MSRVEPAKSKRRRLGEWLLGAALLYLASCLLARALYRHALYPAPPIDPALDPAGSVALSLEAADGVPVHALLIPRDAAVAVSTKNHRTIVYFHGNGEVIGYDEPIARALSDRGFDVVLVEYRGYGRSKGTTGPTEAGLYADAEAVIAELKARGVTPNDTILWGQSLGTGVASEMAARGHGAALVLITPFTSIPDVGARLVPWLPVHAIVADEFDTYAKARSGRLGLPTFILHGTADRVVPFDMGVTLSRALPRCTFIRVDGADHNDVFRQEAAAKLDTLAAFARGGGH